MIFVFLERDDSAFLRHSLLEKFFFLGNLEVSSQHDTGYVRNFKIVVKLVKTSVEFLSGHCAFSCAMTNPKSSFN